MDQQLEYEALTAWVKGTLRPAVPYENIQVSGPRIRDPRRVTWDMFACLYPDSPTYRLYSAPGTSAVVADQVRREIAGIVLPARVTREYDAVRARVTATQVRPLTRHIGVPLGMYVIGRYRTGKGGQAQPIAMLWHIASLPTAFVLDRLQHVAKG